MMLPITHTNAIDMRISPDTNTRIDPEVQFRIQDSFQTKLTFQLRGFSGFKAGASNSYAKQRA